MGERIWIVDNDPNPTYPIYTRGNIGEVFPEAVAPLTWTFSAKPIAEQGFRDALVRFGAFDPEEFGDEPLLFLGCFGGYGYLNVSLSRILAVRTPGLTPELIDQTFFGDSEAPPYQPLPTDESPRHTERITQTLGWIMTADSLPELLDEQHRVDDIVRSRPDLTLMTNEELVQRSREIYDEWFLHLFAQHIFITYCATVPVGAIQAICNAVGDPTLAIRLIAGIGDVDSAAPSWAMWELSREVRGVPALGPLFDAGVDGLLDRLRGEPAAASFLKGFDELLERFGSRGPNEWETRSPTWGTRPELALAAIDRMRLVEDVDGPQMNWDERAAERESITATITEALAGNPEVQGQFTAAVRAAQLFLSGRERTKTTVIKLLHEGRLCWHELGQRMVRDGVFDDVGDYGMLLADEFDDFLADPAAFRDRIRERMAAFEVVRQLEPPFIVNGVVPPLSEWHKRGEVTVEQSVAGAVLTGIAGCPGQHTGRARVVLNPEDPMGLEPGDVLVAPITDPAWTPLFVSAGAVVVDVGAQASHAVIVARELGIPCVVSVTDATKRIPDGATLQVDGTTGTVTVIAT